MVKKASHSNDLPKALGVVLADTYVLAVKTHGYHWNVTGMHFSALHALFDGQYTGLFAAADELAERIRALGQLAPGSMTQLLNLSSVTESGTKPQSAPAILADLVKAHEAVLVSIEAARVAAAAAADAVTDDLLIQRRTEHDKTLWMLRAHLA
ncbi:MAG: DNA starvation/stationary phase protection protein [Alphaproteobacteria bacterium]|nr:DNA starvation/stationary phase protection protein [Alphaproteobacteria bacterium]